MSFKQLEEESLEIIALRNQLAKEREIRQRMEERMSQLQSERAQATGEVAFLHKELIVERKEKQELLRVVEQIRGVLGYGDNILKSQLR